MVVLGEAVVHPPRSPHPLRDDSIHHHVDTLLLSITTTKSPELGVRCLSPETELTRLPFLSGR